MRKIYLMGFMALASATFAQAPKILKSKFPAANLPAVSAKKITASDVFVPSSEKIEIPRQTKQTSLNKMSKATIIGVTQNDQQTNASIYNRIHVFPDGKISAIWTLATDGPDASYITRGAGYQHFNGTNWLPLSQVSTRIDPERTGFPCYAYNPTTNEEIIMSHIVKAQGTANAGASAGLMFNRKPGIGPGSAWTGTPVLTESDISSPSVLWNRTKVAGDYLYVVASYTDSSSTGPQKKRVKKAGVVAPMVFSRYKVSTNTWDIVNQTLPGYDSIRYVSGGGDNYSIDVRGNEVAILACDLTDDIALWRSSDNGTNWTKKVIKQFPIGALKLPSPVRVDTTLTADGTCNVVLDDKNKAHCFWGRGLVLYDDTTSSSFSLFLGQNSIDYWYEGRPDSSITSVAGSPDVDGNGEYNLNFASGVFTRIRYGNTSATSAPNATIGPDGTMYLLFSSINEDPSIDDGNGGKYRNVYLSYSKDNGLTWSDTAFNASSFIGIGEEHAFGSIARTVNNSLHYTFLQSAINGLYSASNNSGKTGDFNVYYVNIPVADVMTGKVGVKELKNNVIEVGQNYPNPSNGSTIIPVNFKQAGDATVTVTNLIGQVVYCKNFNNNSIGLNNLEVNMNNANAGVYIYSVETEGYKITNKMIVE